MKYSEAKQGRVFILRLEHGEVIQETIEKFALEKEINSAIVNVVGGVDAESIIVVGPENGKAKKIIPMEHKLDEMHEVTGTGTIFPDSKGKPKLHLHVACGRETSTITGDLRNGAIVWHILEVTIVELINNDAKRILDPNTGFELLEP